MMTPPKATALAMLSLVLVYAVISLFSSSHDSVHLLEASPATTIKSCNCNSTTPTTRTTTTRARTDKTKSFVVLVQGNADVFSTWATRFSILPFLPALRFSLEAPIPPQTERPIGTIKLIYASFDRPVNDQDGAWRCNKNTLEEEDASFSCDTLFIPNSTWTQGRNALTRAAWCQQEKQQTDYKYWVFADDDLDLECYTHPGADQLMVGTTCWKQYFRFLDVQATNLEIPFVAVLRRMEREFLTSSNYDAMLNAFHGKVVQQLLPYVYMPPQSSWWHSQAAHFMVTQTCFKELGLALANIRCINEVHRKYERGLNLTEITDITKKNFRQYVPGIHLPRVKYEVDQHFDGKRFSNMTAVTIHMSNQRTKLNNTAAALMASCNELSRRFQNFLHRSNQTTPGDFGVCDSLPYLDKAP